MSNLIVLPRPGTARPDTLPIPAPSEASFVAAFGQVLPPASFLDTPDGRAAYYSLPPSSPPDEKSPISRVLFVHGVQTPAIGLQPLASALSSRFPHAHLVLVDLWGHGLTATPVAAHDASLFHTLLEVLMVHLGWQDAHLVGFSFGAATTASFTAAKPERVASATLVAPAGFIQSAQFDEDQRNYLRGGEGLEEKAREWVFDFLEGGQLVVPEDWEKRVAKGEVVAEAVRDWQVKNHPGHAASVVAIFRDGGVLDTGDEFARAVGTGRRILCVLGELDDLSSVGDFEGVGIEKVAVVEGAGHAVVRTNVPEVTRLVEEFWRQL